MTRHLLPAAAIALLCVTPGAAKRARPVPCNSGRYVFDGGQLVAGAASFTADAIDVQPAQITLGSCALARPRLRATKRGTTIRARWSGCSGVRGKVKLIGRIASGCGHMKGTIRVPKRKPFRFGATRSTCGDGVLQPDRGEECEGDATCRPGTHCTLACRCRGATGGGPPTTTTTLPPPGLTIRWTVPPPAIFDSGQTVPLALEVSGCGAAIDGTVYACPLDVPVGDCTGSSAITLAPDGGHFSGAPGTFSLSAQGLQCADVADYYVVASVNLADGAENAFGPFPSPPVAFRLRPAGPTLAGDVDALTFDTQPGQTPPAQAIGLASACGEALPFSVSTDAPWLVVTPATGSLDADGSATLMVGVDPTAIGSGPFTATISIGSPATSAPASIPVALHVVDVTARWTAPVPAVTGTDAVPLALEVSGAFAGVEGDLVACTPDVAPPDCFDTGPFDFGPDAGHFVGPPGTFAFQADALDCDGPEDFSLTARYVVTDAAGNLFGPFFAPATPTRVAPPPGPILLADPDTLDVGAMVGRGPVSQTVTLFTACGEPVSFGGVAVDAPWLGVSPSSGTIARDDAADLTVTVDPAGVDPPAAGTVRSLLHATISVPSTATDTPIAVPVALDLVTPVTAQWTTPIPGTVATNQAFPLALQVSGGLPVDGDVVACTTDVSLDECFDAGVFAIDPAGGHFSGGPATFAFTASGFDCSGPERINLAPRFFVPDTTGHFDVGPFFGPTLATTVRPPGGPLLVIDPAALVFDVVVGQTPATQTVSLFSACGQALGWRSVDASAPWLSATPHAGPIPADSSADVTVSVDASALGASPGPLRATLGFTAPATNGPVVVPVTVNVLDCGR